MGGLTHSMTATASTKRSPDAAGGKVGARETHLSGVKITPLMPASRDTVQHPAMQAGTYVLWEAYTNCHTHTDDGVSVTQLPDIVEGRDLLVVDGTEYVVQYVGRWPAVGSLGAYLQIVVREYKP